jgi:hypothetical protein
MVVDTRQSYSIHQHRERLAMDEAPKSYRERQKEARAQARPKR